MQPCKCILNPCNLYICLCALSFVPYDKIGNISCIVVYLYLSTESTVHAVYSRVETPFFKRDKDPFGSVSS